MSSYWQGVVGFAIVIVLFAAFVVVLNLLNVISLTFVLDFWHTGYGPLATSLVLTAASYLFGFFGAMPLGLIRAYGRGVLRRRKGAPPDVVSFARARDLYGTAKAVRVVAGHKLRRGLIAPFYGLSTFYVEAVRGTPFLVQTFLVFYVFLFAFPQVSFLGADVYFLSGLAALTINTLGYQSEVLRAGFQSVGQGQIEAAKAIGLKGRQVFAYITLPQSLRLIVLPLVNEFIALFKASTILSYIAIFELFRWSGDLGQKYGHPIEGFLMISMIYLLINVPLGRAVSFIEQKKRIPGLGTPLREARKRDMIRFLPSAARPGSYR